MKVAHFTSSFFPVFGGASTRNYNLLRNTSSDHYIFSPNNPSHYVPESLGKLLENEIYENFKIKRVELKNKYGIYLPMITYLQQIKYNSEMLVNSVEDTNFDIVHAHSPIEFAKAGTIFAKNNNIPLLYEFHRLWFEVPRGYNNFVTKNLYKFNKSILRNIDKKIVETSDVILTQCDGYYNSLIEFFGIPEEKLELIRIGVDEGIFNPNNFVSIESKSKIRFIYSGFMSTATGTDFLLKVLQKIPKRITNRIEVIFIGRGPMELEVKQYCEQNEFAEFLGLKDYTEMPEIYFNSDVMLLPVPGGSWAELGPPIKLLEGMAMEMLIFASNTGGILEAIEPMKNGVCFQKGSEADFIDKIEWIVEHFNKAKVMQKEARKTVINRYSWKESGKQLESLYRRMTK